MKQRSKLFSLLLALCMVVTLLPAAAFAQETIAGESPAKAQGVAPAALSSTNDVVAYATASLELTGYTAGANINKATIKTTTSTGFQKIELTGFDTSADGKFDKTGAFSQGQTYYVMVEIKLDGGYEVEVENGQPKGVTLDGATLSAISGNKLFLTFKMNAAPAAATPSATFTDGFGATIASDSAHSYTKGTSQHVKGYTFAGWFDENGDELTNIDSAAPGATYTAKWAKNNKTVRTAPLIFTTGTEWQTGCTQNNTLWTNAAEGWSWDTQSKTLTLFGATIDVPGDSVHGAVNLPDGTTIKTEAGTENTVIRQSRVSGIVASGKLTIEGSGELSAKGTHGIYVSQTQTAPGEITIKAPLTATATEGKGAIFAQDTDNGTKSTFTVDPSVRFATPADGEIVAYDDGKVVVSSASRNIPSTTVMIEFAPNTITGITLTPATASVEKGKTQQFTAAVTGTGSYNNNVTWSVTGANSADTKVVNGVLTVGANETAATITVTVKAAGDETKTATATVTVTAPSTAPKYYYKGTGTTNSTTPAKSPKTADAGIALYAGMAVASLLGSGVVLNRKRKNF